MLFCAGSAGPDARIPRMGYTTRISFHISPVFPYFPRICYTTPFARTHAPSGGSVPQQTRRGLQDGVAGLAARATLLRREPPCSRQLSHIVEGEVVAAAVDRKLASVGAEMCGDPQWSLAKGRIIHEDSVCVSWLRRKRACTKWAGWRRH